MKKTPESIQKKAEIFRSLGHPARVQILILLKSQPKGKLSVTQIHEELGLTQPEASRHLSVLKNSSVLNSEKNGINTLYFIKDEHSFIHCLANSLSKSQGK